MSNTVLAVRSALVFGQGPRMRLLVLNHLGMTDHLQGTGTPPPVIPENAEIH